MWWYIEMCVIVTAATTAIGTLIYCTFGERSAISLATVILGWTVAGIAELAFVGMAFWELGFVKGCVTTGVLAVATPIAFELAMLPAGLLGLAVGRFLGTNVESPEDKELRATMKRLGA